MHDEIRNLRIDRSDEASGMPRWARRLILAGVVLLLASIAALFLLRRTNAAPVVEVARVVADGAAAGPAEGEVVLQASGYIVAAHKIEVASKVVGRVAWIGVDKGDHVKKGDVLVRLEDEEYRAQLEQARGQLASLQARLAELEAGSRPEEIAAAKANLEQAQAERDKARIQLERVRRLAAEGVLPQSQLDDAEAQYRSMEARVASLQKAYELVRIGPRPEQIDAARGQLLQAKGAVALAETQLENTIIRAPVSGTILERNVEIGEFVTTGFVGERGAKGYVVSLADLNDLEVELDISQSDFNKLRGPRQRALVSVEAYPDKRWDGVLHQIAPEADRQKATVQVKVKILKPDAHLRPEMNASVAFLAEARAEDKSRREAAGLFVPAAAVRDGKVFVVINGRAVARQVRTGTQGPLGLKVESGVSLGEEVIVNPPANLKDGAGVSVKSASN